MKEKLNNIYKNTSKNIGKREIKNRVVFSFIDYPKVTIYGNKKASYLIKFINNDNNRILYETTINNECWTQCAYQYYVNWRIEVYENNKLFNIHFFNLTNKKVYIHFDSTCLGDNLAWMPYVEEFRIKNKCKVVLSGFINNLFKEKYPEITFVNPGYIIDNIYVKYTIGLYYKNENIDFFRNVCNFKTIPLQKIASDILGLEYKEIKPEINTEFEREIEEKYICISPHASRKAKYWNLNGGWQEIIDWLNNNGYKVVLISQEKNGDESEDLKNGKKLLNVIDKSGNFPLENRIADLKYASAFIGLGSGLSWLSWATGTPVTLISGFSQDWCEFQSNCQRVINKNVCHGCFNDSEINSNAWNICPKLKNTSREFECSKEISVNDVKIAIKNILKDITN